jgi:hypothetical protein
VIYLGDFAAFYFVPMLLYVIIYTRIAITLYRANNLTTGTTVDTDNGQRRSFKGMMMCASVGINSATRLQSIVVVFDSDHPLWVPIRSFATHL